MSVPDDEEYDFFGDAFDEAMDEECDAEGAEGNVYLEDHDRAIGLAASLLPRHNHFSKRQEVLAHLDHLIDVRMVDAMQHLATVDVLAESRHLKKLSDKLLAAKQIRALNNKTVVGLGGRFSAGKSSFINSRLKSDAETILLPENQNPTTSIPTYVVSGPQNGIRAYLQDGWIVPLELEAMQAMTHDFYEKYQIGFARFVRSLMVYTNAFPKEISRRIALLDTPGYNKADTYLKIAAGNGEMEAVRILAQNLWWRLVHDDYWDDSEEEQEARLLNCRKLFEFLSGKYPEDEKIRETLGFIHLRRGDEQRALAVWMACHTAEARFQCGCLYEYDKGTFPQDLDKAAKFFSEARELGSKKAGAEYEKVQAWKRKKASKEKSSKTYRKTSNYSTRTKSTRSSDDDSCFITTAVCRALQKGDDCEELMAMRHFRDDARAADPLLQEMIGEYYRVAPAIIQRIQASGQADEVYEQLWTDDLCPVLRHLHRREYHQAALGYIAMVERLSHQYGVPLQSGIEEDIAAYRQRGAVPL